MTIKLNKSFGTIIFGLVLLYASSPKAFSDINASQWKLSDEGVQIVQKDNQDVFKLTSGKLTLLDQQPTNGTIEFEMMTPGARAFVYAYFREKGRESEHVYIRTHKSNSPDTVQYSPVFQGRSAWQIYHGKKGTGAAAVPPNQWFKVKVIFNGDFLNMWVGDMQTPVFNNLRLAGTNHKGAVSLRGFIPNGSEATHSAYIRNVSITTDEAQVNTNIIADNSDNKFITQLKVSSVFEAPKEPIASIPASLSNGDWTTVTAQTDGIFEFLRTQQIPNGVRSYAVVAEANLRANDQHICRINLGFSDTISVLLNEQIVGFADHSYRYAQNRQQGVLHDKQLTLYLPLYNGDNKLQMIVADSFGGWGLQASLVDCSVE